MVFPRVKHQGAVRVADFQVAVAQEMVAVLDVRIQVVQLHPMQVPVGALAHQGTVVDHEVVEVSTQVDVGFAWRPQLHNGRVVVQNVHAIHGPGRRVQDDRGLGHNMGQQRQRSAQGSRSAKGKRQGLHGIKVHTHAHKNTTILNDRARLVRRRTTKKAQSRRRAKQGKPRRSPWST